MEFFELVNIAERYMELINPSTPDKILAVGRALGLRPDSRVVDFGCGFGEALALWGQQYGSRGVGVDIRPYACERARQKLAARGLADRIEIVCAAGAEYRFETGAFDAAACIGASFIWGGYRPALQAMKEAVHAGGRLAIGEPYWRTAQVPPAFAQQARDFHSEIELLRIARAEGFDLQTVVRASEDDWDRYQSDNWYGLLRWLEENPTHPERQHVLDHLRRTQEDYLDHGRAYLGWAMYVLVPRQT